MTSLFIPIKLFLEFYYMSNGLTFSNIQYNFAKFLPTLGYDLKIAGAKFQENWFIIDGEINEKHALQIYQNECGPGYSRD